MKKKKLETQSPIIKTDQPISKEDVDFHKFNDWWSDRYSRELDSQNYDDLRITVEAISEYYNY